MNAISVGAIRESPLHLGLDFDAMGKSYFFRGLARAISHRPRTRFLFRQRCYGLKTKERNRVSTLLSKPNSPPFPCIADDEDG